MGFNKWKTFRQMVQALFEKGCCWYADSTRKIADIVKSIYLLPLYQKEVYTLLRETYLKTPDDYRDNNYTIQN